MKLRNDFKPLLLVLLTVLVIAAAMPKGLPGAVCSYAEGETGSKRPTVLLILDGFGLSDESEHNAIAQANTPVLDRLMKECPFVKGEASGLAVGLPEGQMGSSEVGHLNIGAGRIVYQDLVRITKAIQDGDFFENEVLLKAVNNAKEKGTSLHILGLVSDGGVHSHNAHLYALLELAKRQGLEKVYVHCFTDGRDTSPESGKDYIQALEDEMDRIGCGKIATVGGRYYGMDRDNRWDRVEKAYRAMTLGEGVTAESALEAVTQSYEKGDTDEFILPTVVMEDGKPVATIGDGDSVIFFNFRSDRAKEITRAFCCDEFDGFDRGPRKQVTYVCFTDYDVTIPNKEIAFDKVTNVNTLGEWLAVNGLKQARIAETEKYAHVTSFFNGGVEAPNEGEDRFLIPSPHVATYDLQPEMSAREISDTLIEKIRSGDYDVIVANFANSDMVGHNGVEAAAIEAVACLDECIGRVVETIKEVDGQLFICADHGNAETMADPETGEPLTSHTTNPVPFILVNYDPAYTLREGGCLADVAPTLLEMMGLEKPAEMTGESLLQEKPAAAEDGASKPFAYEHDPRDNPEAMKDIIVNPDAVYGFSPNPESTRLKSYADALDWTDPKQVADARALRQAYHDSMSELYRMIEEMLLQGDNVETIARAVSQRRNELRLEAEKDDPEALKLTKQSNLDTYGNEFGPTPDQLYEKYGSWQTVLEKALGTNAGMDACLGFYDEYYDMYDIGTTIEKEKAN